MAHLLILSINRANHASARLTIISAGAAEALAVVRGGTPVDLVFTDILMPGSMDGWQLAEAIRQIRPHMKIPYTTGYSNVSSERMGSVAGIHLLEKPYRLSRLAQMIRQAIAA